MVTAAEFADAPDRRGPGSRGRGGSALSLDAARLAALRPGVILTHDLGAVCPIETVRAAAAGMDPRPAIVGLNPRTVEGVLDDCLTVGAAVGMREEAGRAVVDLRARLFRAQEYVNPFVDGPVVGFLEWTDPLVIAGDWTVQLIERAGGRHPLNPTVAAEDAGAAAGPQQSERRAGGSMAVPEDVFVASRPEYLVICPRGLGLQEAMAAAGELSRKSWWGDLPAVRAGRVAVVDGNQMFNRPGPRLAEAFEWLVGWLNGRGELSPWGFPWGVFQQPGLG